jgi:hypothetical protein
MAKRPRGPKTKRGAVLAICATLAAVVLAGVALVYFVLFGTSSPKPFKLAPAAVGTQASSTTGVSGRWQVASGSLAGYRVREQLAFLPAQSDAVGRTSSITGAATLMESKGAVTIEAASFDVAVDTLTSDRSMRDEKIHAIGLESDRYPTATFVLSTPLTLPVSALDGKVAHASASGIFDIHGTSRRETVPLEISLSGQTLQAVGSLTFPWSEFNMSAPSIGGFVTVTDKATMEFDLHLLRGQ